jgi:hypothetical protein
LAIYPGTSFFVPNKLLSPKPALLSECEDEFYDVCVPLTADHLLFDIQDKCTGLFRDAKQFF